MFLRDVIINGFKSIDDDCLSDLGGYGVLIGRNASGKSSYLQAIKLLKGLDGGINNAPDLVTGKDRRRAIKLSLVCDLTEGELATAIERMGIETPPNTERIKRWRFDFELRTNDPGKWKEDRLYVTACSVLFREKAATICWLKDSDRPDSNPMSVPFEAFLDSLRTDSQEAPWKAVQGLTAPPDQHSSYSGLWSFVHTTHKHSAFLQPLAHFVSNLRFLDPVRRSRDTDTVKETWAVGESGELLIRLLDTWTPGHPLFEELRMTLRALFPDVADVVLTTHGERKVVRILGESHEEPLDGIRLADTAMGTHQATILIAFVLSAPENSLLAIEEPENHLHPGAQRKLATFLREHSRKHSKQILVTTQSPVFAALDIDSRLYLIRWDDEKGTKATAIEPGGELVVREEIGARLADLFFYDSIVFWEGSSEASAMPILIEAVARSESLDVSDLGLTSRNLKGAGRINVATVRDFLNLLRDAQITAYVILDDDEGVRASLEELVSLGLLLPSHFHIWKSRKDHGRGDHIGSEFEDNFTEEQLCGVLNEMASEHGLDLDLNPKDLHRRLFDSEKKTTDELRHYCWEKAHYIFEKTELNRRLAELTASEILGQRPRSVEQYEFEWVIRDLFSKLKRESP